MSEEGVEFSFKFDVGVDSTVFQPDPNTECLSSPSFLLFLFVSSYQ